MLGSVLIMGSNKKARLEKAWEIIQMHGFAIAADSPDLLVLQKESEKKSIGIAQAKEVRKFLQERPFTKKVKAVIVEDAHVLTDDAQGSLLKILEEPPAFALIILLCNTEGSLLPTVVSRCQKVVLRGKVLPGSEAAGSSSPQFELATKSYEELFELAKEISQKDKDEAINFLEGLLRYDATALAAPRTIFELEKAIREMKEANVALKFSLEYLFLLHKLLV